VTIKAKLSGGIAAALMASAWAIAAHAQESGASAPVTAGAIDPKMAKAMAQARAKQVAAWKAQYGPGPYPDEMDAYLANRQEKLREYYRVLYYDGEHNAVLNFERLGLLAMELGYYEDAEKAFDGALDRVEAFTSKDKQAAKATSSTRLEANKDFKGEPYERSMAYYYRGLLYLRKGDYDNARASFKAAEYQDTVADDETFQSDFGLLTWLQGWASKCAGDGSQAADAFEAAAKVDPKLKTPGPNDNLLVLAEVGMGPVKATDGQYQEKLVFRPGMNLPENGAIVTLGSGARTRAWPLTPAADLFTQASTRGGRAIDGILNGKAQFKQGLETTSTVANVVSSSLLANSSSASSLFGGSGMRNAGFAAAGAGALIGMLSKTVRPSADVRMWDSLPSSILVGTTAWGAAPAPAAPAKGRKGASVRTVSSASSTWTMPPVSMIWRQGDSALDLRGTTPMAANAGKCGIAWARSRSATAFAAAAPGDNAKVASQRKLDKDAWAKDEAFRAKLR